VNVLKPECYPQILCFQHQPRVAGESRAPGHHENFSLICTQFQKKDRCFDAATKTVIKVDHNRSATFPFIKASSAEAADSIAQESLRRMQQKIGASSMTKGEWKQMMNAKYKSGIEPPFPVVTCGQHQYARIRAQHGATTVKGTVMKVCATSKIQVAWDDCDQNAVSWSWKRGNLEVLMGEVAYCPDDGELHGEFDHIVSIDYNQETASPEVLRIKFKDSDPVWEEDSDQWRKMNADNAFLMNCLETFMQTDTVLQTLKAEIADRRCLHQDKPKRSEHAETKRKVMECAAAGDDSTLKELIGHQMEQSMHSTVPFVVSNVIAVYCRTSSLHKGRKTAESIKKEHTKECQ